MFADAFCGLPGRRRRQSLRAGSPRPKWRAWLTFTVDFHEILKALLGAGAGVGVGVGVGVKNDLDGGGDLAFEMLFGDVFLGVLLEVELATLPRGAVGEALRAAFRPLWASEVTGSGMPMPRSLSPLRNLRQWTSA